MNQPALTQDFITTKDAAEQSGYTTDYLSRLVRTNKIVGHRLGRNWLIEKGSFASFLEQQARQKTRRSKILAHARTEEYRTRRPSAQSMAIAQDHSFFVPQQTRELRYGMHPWRSQALALSAACAVVLVSASAVSSASFVQVIALAENLATDAASGFQSMFDQVVTKQVAHVEQARTIYAQEEVRVHQSVTDATAAAQGLAVVNMFDGAHMYAASLGNGLFTRSGVEVAVSEPIAVHMHPAATRLILASQLSALRYGYEHPHSVAFAAGHAYVRTGEVVYHLITNSLAGYHSLIVRAGEGTLAVAARSFDGFQSLPPIITRINLALGTAVINATHGAIHVEVRAAYGLAWAAPESARTSVVFLGTLGNALARVAAATPGRATDVFLAVTEVPARLAPSISARVWGVEYGAAVRFVAFAQGVQEHYLALVTDGGALTYQGMTVVYMAPSMIKSFPGVPQLASVFAHRFP